MLNNGTWGYCLTGSFLTVLEIHLVLSLLSFFLCDKFAFRRGNDLNYIKCFTGNSSHSHVPDRRNPDLISGGILVLVRSQNPWDCLSQTHEECEHFEIAERFCSAMQRMRPCNQIGKISNKLASPKIFHLFFIMTVFYQAFAHTTSWRQALSQDISEVVLSSPG